jgi:hypothetical protein
VRPAADDFSSWYAAHGAARQAWRYSRVQTPAGRLFDFDVSTFLDFGQIVTLDPQASVLGLSTQCPSIHEILSRSAFLTDILGVH